ncbi:MAG: beta-ketoacyl-ACP synthase III [Saprospiraceae bacterium]|nr:beta-ketoacyl-ACP synthase III [Saprospiraceae bacterium]MBK7811390.1 beta-ketoacyl-ACP synthase III [Saprospiraceae bacterium]
MKCAKPIRIISCGIYLPEQMSSETLELKFNLPEGCSKRISGVNNRHHVTFETNGFMGARAIESALTKAELALNEIDLLISAGATYDYPIPSQSSIIKRELYESSEIHFPVFDINSTCLSFVSAFEVAAKLLDGIQYKRIIIVSSEIASKGLNPAHPETLTLFGDGAVAFILEYNARENSMYLNSYFETYTEGAFHTIIRGGGNVNYFRNNPFTEEMYTFEMHGLEMLKLAKKTMPKFVETMLKDMSIDIENIDVIIPHQASKTGIQLFEKMFSFKPGQVKSNLENFGNCIAASIPLLLHQSIEQGELKRGNLCLLIGTSAGFSIGGLFFKY